MFVFRCGERGVGGNSQRFLMAAKVLAASCVSDESVGCCPRSLALGNAKAASISENVF
jgi:hypothetical protein